MRTHPTCPSLLLLVGTLVLGVVVHPSTTTSNVLLASASSDIPTQQAEQAAAEAMATFGGVLSSTAATFLSKRSTARNNPESCTSQGTNACVSANPGTPAANPPTNLSLDLTTGTPIPRDANFVQIKRFDGQLPSDWKLTVCPAVNLGLTWAANYEGKNPTSVTKPGSVLHQYFAGSDEAFAMYPARHWSEASCSKTSKSNLSLGYRPTERPYYTSGASGPKDLVILIDVSDYMPGSESRLEVAKETAKRLLGTLSFSDFVAVVPFHRVADGNVSTTMQRASLDVITDLQAKVDSIQLSNYSKLFDGEKIPASLGAAMRAAGNLLNTGSLFSSSSNAAAVNLGTSGCSKTIIFLSSGINTISVPSPVGEFFNANVSSAAVFGFVIVPTATDLTEAENLISTTQDKIADSGNASTLDSVTKASAKANQIAALACAGSGVYRIAFTSNGDEDIATPLVDAFTNYFSALVENTQGGPRWSEIYDDVFGQGKVASASLPMYEAYREGDNGGGGDSSRTYVPEPNVSTADQKEIEEWNGLPKELVGMVVMDVPLGNLSGGGTNLLLNETQVESVILREDTCVPVNFQSDKSAAKVSSLSNAEKCVNVPGETLDVVEMRPLYICISVFTPLLMVLIPCLVTRVKAPYEGGSQATFGSIAFLLCWVICLSVFWTLIFDQIVRRDFWVKMEYTVRSHSPNEWRCCNIVDCSCSNYYGRSCAEMVNRLEPGSCSNGYHCCRQESYSCNCRTRRSCSGSGKKRSCSSHYHCDTCYRCVQSVSNWKCRSNCGKCYSPVIAISYVYQGRTIVSHLVKSCTNVADATQCLYDFFLKNPVNSKSVGYVNPANPMEISSSDGWSNAGALAGFIIVALLSIAPLAVVWFFGCPLMFEAVRCKSRSGSSSSGRDYDTTLLDDSPSSGSGLNNHQGMTAAQKLEAQMIAEQEAEFSKPEPPVPSSFPPPPPPPPPAPPAPLPTNVNPNPSSSANVVEPGYNTQWGADSNNPWGPGGQNVESGGGAAPHYDIPAPPPAPQSEHTLGLPDENINPGDGRLPPPPGYGADAL